MGIREIRRQRVENQAKGDAGIARVTLSTLSTSSRPFNELGLVWGESAPDEARALENLQRSARDAGCDAVLGMSLYSAGSTRLFSTRRRNDEWRAFGTGVSWRS